MNWRTLGHYLLGRRPAILEIARCREAVWLGLAFVLLAGIARDYDGEDLLAQPYWLALPFAASLVTSLLLYGLERLVAMPKPPARVVSYRQFLALYWLTAPLAWLYALPVERLMSEGAAAESNLWLLAIVATWRVVLMVRVFSVLFGVRHGFATAVVLFFADSVVAVASWQVPIPIFNVIGGVLLSDSESVLLGSVLLTRVFSVLLWPIFLIALLTGLWRRHRERVAQQSATTAEMISVPGAPSVNDPRLESEPESPLNLDATETLSPVIWSLPAALLLLSIGLLAWAQPEQRLRGRVERLLRSGQLAEGVRIMSVQRRSDFPPHWDPPPRTALGETTPSPATVARVAIESSAAEWVVTTFVEKVHRQFADEFNSRFVIADATDQEIVDSRGVETFSTLQQVPVGRSRSRVGQPTRS